MSQTKKSTTAAARKKAAAARAEKAKRTITYRELEIELPKELGSDVAFDYIDILEGRVDIVTGSVRLLRSILAPEQFEEVRAKLATDGVPLQGVNDALGELIEQVFDHYGITAGN